MEARRRRSSLGLIAAFVLAASAVVAVAWRSAAGERGAVERDVAQRLEAQAGEAVVRVGDDLGVALVRNGRFLRPAEPRPLARLRDSDGRDPIGDQLLADAAQLELDPARAADAERALRELANDSGAPSDPGRDVAVRRLARFRLAALLSRTGSEAPAAQARAAFLADLADADDDARHSAEALLARIAAGEHDERLRDDLLLALGTGDDGLVLAMARAAGVADAPALARRRDELARLDRLRPLAARGAFAPTVLADGSLAVAVADPGDTSALGDQGGVAAPVVAIATAGAAELDAETRRRLRLQWLALTALLGGGALLLFFTLRAVRRESEAAAARAAFVARVSHDLRTPLSVIRMYAETLAQGRATDPEQVREFAGVAAREATRLSELVARVLDFSRATMHSGQERALPRAPVDVGALLQELASEQQGALAAAGMQLGLVVSGAPLFVRGDREGLRAALANLVENALRHAASGARVEIAAAASGGDVEVRVSDRGPGLPSGLEARIFEPFVRGPQARPGGSGLGLALVREVAAAHRGRVSAANRDGGGATFVLALPRAPDVST